MAEKPRQIVRIYLNFKSYLKIVQQSLRIFKFLKQLYRVGIKQNINKILTKYS